jgi:hypothetical protein
MSDDLVRRLACPYPKDEDVEEVNLPLWVLELTTEAADCIEELEGQLKTVLDRETSILRYYDAKLDAADAKLAQAVEALEFYADADNYEDQHKRESCGCCYYLQDAEIKQDEGVKARTTLAALKGEQP